MRYTYDWLKGFSYVEFPAIHDDDPEIISVGGVLTPDYLLSAYSQGIFAWYSEGQPILWWSLNPRYVLFPEKLHVSKTMRKLLKKTKYTRTVDKAFSDVIHACASMYRPGQDGTWITPNMIKAYCRLYKLGFAHSVELWDGMSLVGGLYGVSLGNVFFGESMFSLTDDASKLAFIPFVWRLIDEGFTLIDCQMETHHLASLGGESIPRKVYLSLLEQALTAPTRRGNWNKLWKDYPISSAWNKFFNSQG